MGRITSEWILETGKSQSNVSELTQTIENYNTTVQKAGDAGKDVFRESAKSTQDYNKSLSDNLKTYQKVEAVSQSLKKELNSLGGSYTNLVKEQRKFTKSSAEYAEIQKEIVSVKKRISELKNEIGETEKKTSNFGDTLKRVGTGIAAYFTIDTIINFGKRVFEVTAEFQKFEAVLTTSLGSGSAAERAMLMIQDFASKTPFSVADLTDSFVKFSNRGIKLTVEQMTALGDLASSTGKSFDQLTEAALDALSGENERLKEFGITATKVGDKTLFTFKGVTTEVKNTDEAVKAYLISLGKVEGVTGSMAAISETLTGQVSNLGDTLDQFFLTIGSSNSGVMSGFIGFLNESLKAVTNLIASTDQLGKNFSAAAVTKYADETKAKFEEIAANATKSGEDVAMALKTQGETMRADLEAKLQAAEENLNKFREQRSTVSEVLDLSGTTFLKNKSIEAGLASLVEKYKGQVNAITDVTNEILKPKTPGVDKEALKAAEKAAKDQAAARKKALADLNRELEKLEKEANKARLEMLDKDSKEYQLELYAQRTKEIDIVEDTIKELEKKAGKDSILNPEQVKQIGILREAALREYQENLYNIELEQKKKLLDLAKDSDAKELAQITLKYDTEIEAAQRNKNQALAIALEKAKEMDLARTKFAQANRNIDAEEDLASETALLFKVDNTNTDAIELERRKQQALLEVQIEFAKKRMNLLEFETGEEATTRRFALQNLINDLQIGLDKLNQVDENQKFNLMSLLGIDEEDQQAVQEGLNVVMGYVSGFTAQQLAYANQLLEQRRAEVEEKEEQLDREIELNKQGFASNVETKRAELEEARKQREQALKEQRQAQRAQNTIDTISQVSNLITAGSTIFKATAPLNVIPGLGTATAVALIAAMVGAFVSLKAKAGSLTKAEKGWDYVGGKRHTQGGNKYVSLDDHNDVLEIEEGERIVNRKSNKKYWEWLNAINQDNEGQLSSLALKYLLQDTGVVPARDLAQKVERKAEAYHQQRSNSSNLERKVTQLHNELIEIRRNTAPQKKTEHLPDRTIVTNGNTIRTTKI